MSRSKSDTMKGTPKLVGYGLAVSFFALLFTSIFPKQIQLAYAGDSNIIY